MGDSSKLNVATQTTSEQLYSTIVDNTGEAIIVIQNQRIRFCNHRAVELSGYSENEIRRLSWLNLIHPDDRELVLSECSRASRLKEHARVYSIRIHDRGGNSKWLELHHRQISWNGRDATLVFFRDITERKLLESQFLQAQKMEAVGRLAGGIAHDFNNFLTVILGNTELLEKEMLAQCADSTNVQVIREAAKKASVLTQQLLAFSRKQHLEPKIINPNKLIDGMQRMLKRLVGENTEIVMKTDSRVGSIHADANQLEQVVLNLAVNSKDAMEDGGKLVISTENVYFSEESLKPKPEMRPGRYVMLCISDTGSGMDEATKSHLFEPFFTTKESGRGTGLGLATVYGIIKQSKGFIYVYSELGKGTTFKLYFPRIDKQPTEKPPNVTHPKELKGNEKVLVLEDEQQVLAIIGSMLQRQGYTVLTTNRGEKAVAQSQLNPGSIDLLITDVGIPDMSGREVWEAIKKGHPNCRVLFISGYPEEFVPLEDIGDGQSIFLQKPFGSEVLLTRVREILNAGPGGSPFRR
jgi:two-component system cell cycle sensor histidine kinase/response regulator CckA